jgi:hypothetical protein
MMKMLATLFVAVMYNNKGSWSSGATKTSAKDSSLYSSINAESASLFQMN